MAENSFKYIKAVSLLKSRVDTAFMVGEECLVSVNTSATAIPLATPKVPIPNKIETLVPTIGCT